MRCCNSYKLTRWVAVSILILTSSFVQAKLKSDQSKSVHQYPQTAADPLTQTRVHKIGNIWLSITNFGQIGSGGKTYKDVCTNQPAPSCQFPAGSGIEYLYIGALWIGAVMNDTDTLVAVGHDGWQNVQEFGPTSTGAIVSRTIRPDGYQQDNCFVPYSDSAKSELDYIAVYYDTVTRQDIPSIPERDRPLNLEITQKSYSWSYEYANDFVLFDYSIKNIGTNKLTSVYIGFYIDFDIYNQSFDGGGYFDDIAGFKFSVPSPYDPRLEDTVSIAWGADNDGLSAARVEGDVFLDNFSPTGVLGTRVLRSPNPDLKHSFNWWVSNGNPQLDFGPWTQANLARRPNYFVPNGQSGTPESDRSKYFIMSNNEFDYDQLFAALPEIWERQGWVNQTQISPDNLADIADGFDSRYLLSFGPFDIDSGEVLPLTIALVAGEDFHVKPTDFNSYSATDSAAVFNFYNKLDFTSLAANAHWAACVYDNPGFDTDGDGYRGEFRIIAGDTIYKCGDGVPDFQGPPPPPAPQLKFETSYGTVKIKWNGKTTEKFFDQFTNRRDFEGYRIYGSWTGILGDFFLLDSFDKMNYKFFYWDKGRKKWVYKLTDLSLDSLVTLFKPDDPCEGARPCPLESLSFCSDPDTCDDWDVARWNLYHPYIYQGTQIETLRIAPNLIITRGDSIYFDRQDYNRGLLPIKTYKDSILNGSIGSDDDRYYEYEYVIDNLNPNEPLYFAVTTFDFGDPITRLTPLETSVLANSKLVYPRVCLAKPGDVNEDGEVLLSDVIAMINIRFTWWPPRPIHTCRMDMNGDGWELFADIIYLVNYLFKGGPKPQVVEECCLVGN
ncbi:MAG: hypothetical protein RBG1_1C00001G0733 [candidate division Zixibacteria bacterium RBG-1]|nr:MAG: hypothetical protein RBG1_1C00001G0733 [candidate division Zixibacteria bacterium RBG-1]OGC86367.1 MAG: hypothetical protein A2V73_02600 [candidate division Zixibacteria bacterium RBG_19FT_COMBO_42_43]